jgi:hypothetical protein
MRWQLRRDLSAFANYTFYDFDQERPLSTFNPKRDYARRIFGFGFQYAFDQEL